MSGASLPPSRSRGSSWFSRFKKRVSSTVSPSPPASSRKQLYSAEDIGGKAVPGHRAYTADLPSASVSQCPAASSVPVSYSATPIPACPSSSRLEDSLSQNTSSMHLTHPSPPRPPDHERQALSIQGPNMFGGAHDFVMKYPVFNDYNIAADTFMEKLLQETIIGAEFDSSAHDPPPRCHPGTRLAIIQRCIEFINQCNDKEKLRWVVGPAGVGKSAVMQMVTEAAPDGIVFASIFLSVNGRRDGRKTVITIAYQLAVKSGPYRQFIRDEISLDPSLLRKSLSVQFKKFIVEPFVLKRIFEPSRRFLVVIDGLDECDDPLTQQALLELISDFCITYPTSPIAWIVASRPEPHITSFFDNPEVRPAFTKEEIVIDSDEACEEVQRYLRDELKKIKLAHATLRSKREWPMEHEFTKIASAAGGLFAYAATVIRYIRDHTHGGPAAQLRRVLETIDATVKDHVGGRNHPMDRLDALYKRILSNIPDNIMINTRKLLLIFSCPFSRDLGFRARCNALGLTEDDGYDAISHFHAVMKIPEPDKPDDGPSYYHKSFEDFLSDFERSGFSRDFKSERDQLCNHISLKIIEELQDDSDGVVGGEDIKLWLGLMKGHCENISLSWPGDDRYQMTDHEVQLGLYDAAIRYVHEEFAFGGDSLLIESLSCFHALTIRFTIPTIKFPFYRLRNCACDQFRDELVALGKLKQVPLQTLDYAAVCGNVELRFTARPGSSIKGSDLWDPSCNHQKQLDDLEQRQGWSTKFRRYYQVDSGSEDNEEANIPPRFHVVTLQQVHQNWVDRYTERRQGAAAACIHCSRRLARLFMTNPDQPVSVFVDQTQMCYVELTFVDPDDGLLEWRYRFLHSGAPSSIDA